MTTTDNNNAPETYELPPEPPIGSRVTDRKGNIWTRGEDWWELNRDRISWRLLMMESPLTRIPAPEPDPWPTADYVWGTVESDGGESDGPTLWLRRPSGAYESVESYADSRSNRFTLVVPVTTVPTERVDYLSAAHASWVAGAIDDKTMIGYAIGLLESLDELGLDQ